MSRRASLPGAAELFRSTAATGSGPDATDGSAETVAAAAVGGHAAEAASDGASRGGGAGTRRGSGRQRHDSKITVYVADAELIALEQARLSLRGEHGLAVDRGRIVREAIAMVLADLDAHGADSSLVHRLRQEPRR